MPREVRAVRPNLAAHASRASLTKSVALAAVWLLATALPAAAAGKRHAAPVAARTADDTARGTAYGTRVDVMRFGAEVAVRHDLDPAWVEAVLSQARFVPTVARLMMPAPAGSAKNWAAYRSRFVEPMRIRAGAAFWRANAAWLRLAEERYGVPPDIVVGIIGVETIYGQQMGNFPVIDALATLSFDFPPGRKDRSDFFRGELESFLVTAHQNRADPRAALGSFAGAAGMPQFMPSSVEKFAVDFDGDGRIDLAHEPADVIGSVARYLADFGWQRGLATRFGVAVPVETVDRAALLGPDILPTFTLADFAAHGARLDAAAFAADVRRRSDDKGSDRGGDGIGKLALVELQNGDAAPSYVAGTANFYAVTRYNWSSYYALAVIELGEAVAREVVDDNLSVPR